MTPGTIVECIDADIPPEQYIEVKVGERYTVPRDTPGASA